MNKWVIVNLMIGKWFWFDLGICVLKKWTKIEKVIIILLINFLIIKQ